MPGRPGHPEGGDERATYAVVFALVTAETDLGAAAEQWALVSRLLIPRLGLHVDPIRHAWPRAVDAAPRLGRREEAEALLALVEADLRAAVDELDRLGYPYWRALADADLADELKRQGWDEEAASVRTAATGIIASSSGQLPSRRRDNVATD